jgi:hypothetical protein
MADDEAGASIADDASGMAEDEASIGIEDEASIAEEASTIEDETWSMGAEEDEDMSMGIADEDEASWATAPVASTAARAVVASSIRIIVVSLSSTAVGQAARRFACQGPAPRGFPRATPGAAACSAARAETGMDARPAVPG